MTLPRILWLHTHFMYFNGGTKFIYEVVSRLAPKCSITVCVQKASPFVQGLYRERGIELLELGGISSMDLAYWAALPYFLARDSKQIARRVPKADLVISSMFPANCVARRAFQTLQAQYCFEPYAPFFDYNYVSHTSLGKRWFYRLTGSLYAHLDREATRNMDLVWTLNKTNAKWIEEAYHRESILTGEGVNLSRFKRTPDLELRSKYKDRLLLMHSTDYTPIKGTRYLLAAMPAIRREFPNVKLLITTCYPGSAREKMAQETARKLGTGDAVEFVGFLSETALPGAYTTADLVIQPSIDQPESLSTKEAMACGAVVVRSGGGESEIVHGITGWRIPERNSTALTDAVVTLLRDPALRQRIGMAAAEHASKTWSWENVADRIWDGIMSLCDRTARYRQVGTS